jgi:putative membrane protein
MSANDPKRTCCEVGAVCYVTGVLAFYAVLQTRFEYLAQHMFFLNRVQQTVMHDFGPVLIALAWPGAVIYLGMPRLLRRLIEVPLLLQILRVLKQPMLASFLFVGVVAFWLVPRIHFRALLDPKLYQVMRAW